MARVLSEPRHAMQIIGMDILLEGRGRAKSALLLFKRIRFQEVKGTSNGQKYLYETKLVLHLGTSTSRDRMQKSSHPSA